MSEDSRIGNSEQQGPEGGSVADRSADRVAVKLPVKIELDTAQAEQSALTGNVSNTGMFLAFKSPPPVGTLARFEIQRASGPPVLGIGEVVWIRVRWSGKGRPPGMGVHFRFLDREGRESLEALIADGLARGLRIEGDVDTDREAARPDEPEVLIQHRPYGKPLTLDEPPRPQLPTTRPASPAGRRAGDSEEVSQGWDALRKWANAPAPGRTVAPGQTDDLGRTTTPLLGNLGDKAKLIAFGVLVLVLLIVLL